MNDNIYFIRHGETDRNLIWMINPWDVDSKLNDIWIQQAHRAGKAMKENGLYFDIIISSSLQRATKTAKIIATEIWYTWKIIKKDSLKERFAGIFKDYYKKNFLEEFGVKYVSDLIKKFPDKTFEWVEMPENFEQRITQSLSSIVNNDEYKNKKVLIVAHWWVGDIITGSKKIDNCKLTKVII